MRILTLAITLLLASSTMAQYESLHDKLIKFYGFQRAGLADGKCYNLNSGWEDGKHKGDNYNGYALDGGWYDAGDYVKFGMPLSYTVYCLLKGYDVFPNAYDNDYDWTHNGTDNIPDILNQVKFATDYLIKAVKDENTVILDVANGHTDHGPMDVVMNPEGRNWVKLCDGADIPARYAASLALMSTLYREFDSDYADKCLEKAKVAFKFAKNKIDEYDRTGNENVLYCSPQDGGFYDYAESRQMLDAQVAAGVELYRATNDEDPIYRKWAKKGIKESYGSMGYQFIGPLASFEVWRQGLGSAASLLNNVNFIKSNIQETGTFEGVFKNVGWGTAGQVGNAAFEFALAYVISSTSASRDEYLQFTKDHIDWLTGNNPKGSFVIGHNSGPNNPHYRGPSLPIGSVVAGPDSDGNWYDNGDANYTEPAIDYNAGAIGAVAFLKALENPGDAIRMVSAFSANPNTDVDLNAGGISFSAQFDKSVSWEIKIEGSVGTDLITGNGTSINENWDGTIEDGFFLSGELVNAKLIVDGAIAAYDLLSAKPISITIANAKKPDPKPGDVLFDDLEDGDEINAVGGIWEPNGTGTGIAATRINFTEEDGAQVIRSSGRCATNGPTEYTGIRATFNSDGTPASLGTATSMIFDLKANLSTNVSVELEQANVSDGAYHRVEIPVTEEMNTYRLNLADFSQPDWKTSEVALDLNQIAALRFTVYDSVGRGYLYVDNVSIENLTVGTARPFSKKVRTSLQPVFTNGTLVYNIPRDISGAVDLSVFNVAGRAVMKQQLNATPGRRASVSLSKLPHGVYTIMHSADGKMIGQRMMIMHVK